MIVHLLPILMFVVLMLLVFTSYPIGFVLGGISIIFGVIGWMSGVFSLIEFFNFAPRIWFIADNFQIIAVPLFVFMGVMLERSEIAKELLEALQLILRRVPGGMAMSVTVMATIFAAITGIIGAAVVVMFENIDMTTTFVKETAPLAGAGTSRLQQYADAVKGKQQLE